MTSKTNGAADQMELSKDILIEDYRNLSESFWKNEQVGDTRVNLFIGFVTAVVGVLSTIGTLERAPTEQTLKLIFTVALAALLLLGIITLLRVLKRNRFTDQIKQSSNEIRQIFKDHFDPEFILVDYFPYGRRRKIESEDDKSTEGKPEPLQLRKPGGLAHLMGSVNSLIVGGLAAAVTYPVPYQEATRFELNIMYIAAGFAFLVSALIQYLYIEQYERDTKSELAKHLPTHAGGIVYCIKDQQVEYLLVGPKEKTGKNAEEWILPKGHIKKREGHGEAALREVREETGVVARWIRLVGRVQFKVNVKKKVKKKVNGKEIEKEKEVEEEVDCKYYLMECLYKDKPEEKRRTEWFAYDAALESLTHKQNIALLKRAERLRKQQVSQPYSSDSECEVVRK